MDLSMFQPAFDLLVDCAAVSLPLVVAAGLVGKAFNALVSVITGERRVKL